MKAGLLTIDRLEAAVAGRRLAAPVIAPGKQVGADKNTGDRRQHGHFAFTQHRHRPAEPQGVVDQRRTDDTSVRTKNAAESARFAFQAATRANLPRFEIKEGKLKINPLADWGKTELDAWFAAHDLPRHPLEAQGYPSIGCAPCTSKVKPGEDPRAGRWRGWDKVECGIHTSDTKPGEEPVF